MITILNIIIKKSERGIINISSRRRTIGCTIIAYLQCVMQFQFQAKAVDLHDLLEVFS